MDKLKIEIDVSKIAEQFGEIKREVEIAIQDGVKKLAVSTHAKVIELAQENLHTTRDKYIEALDFEEIVPGVWVVSVDLSKVGWLEEGRSPGSMIDDLLKSGANVSKEGFRYKAIPFDYGKPPSKLSEYAQRYVNTIKAELKKRSIPFKRIETDATGSPRLGRLHRFNIPSTYPTAKAQFPALHGLSIYQRQMGTNNIRRDIVTFRMVSDKHKMDNRWFHPGITAKKFLDKAMEWAEKEFENEILPTILGQFK